MPDIIKLRDENDPKDSLEGLAYYGPASTLAAIEAKLRADAKGAVDHKKLTVFTHVATNLKFRIGPMGRQAHETWMALRFMEEAQHRDSGAARAGAPLVRDRSDIHLLTSAVWTEDGIRLTDELARFLMDNDAYGPSTYAMLETASLLNPPRQALVGEIQKMWGANAVNFIFWRVLEKAGMFKVVIDRLAGNPEEQAAAAKELRKVEYTLAFWEAGFNTKEIAQDMELDTYDRHKYDPEEREFDDLEEEDGEGAGVPA